MGRSRVRRFLMDEVGKKKKQTERESTQCAHELCSDDFQQLGRLGEDSVIFFVPVSRSVRSLWLFSLQYMMTCLGMCLCHPQARRGSPGRVPLSVCMVVHECYDHQVGVNSNESLKFKIGNWSCTQYSPGFMVGV